MQIDLPALLFISYLGVKDYYLASDKVHYFNREIIKIERSEFKFDTVVVNSFDDDLSQLLKPIFDSIWNACGFKRSYNYDENGSWVAGK